MDKLKQTIFEETLFEKQQTLHYQRKSGEWDDLAQRHKFCHELLYQIIADSKCEDEYFEWVRQQEICYREKKCIGMTTAN